jgi:hypothetical protein
VVGRKRSSIILKKRQKRTQKTKGTYETSQENVKKNWL